MKLKIVLLAVIAMSLSIPSMAQASIYTLDGKLVSELEALDGSAAPMGGGCAAMPSPKGVIECFSSPARTRVAVEGAANKGAIPPGFSSKPTIADRKRLFAESDQTAVASSKNRRSKLAGCGTAAHNFTGGTFTGHYKFFYSTSRSWLNYDSTFNNAISSTKYGLGYGSHYHDLTGGHGNYFNDSAGYCPGIPHLSDHGWNNRFSSFASRN